MGIVAFLSIFAYAERLPVKTYTVADGLLRDMVFKIKQDSRGFLWFCSAEGISRFDGMEMTNFTVGDGLPDRVVNDFLETTNGTIYIATGKGLARLNPHGLRGSTENPLFTVFLPDDPKAGKILSLYEDKKNQVWVGTDEGLYKLIETGGPIAFEHVPLGAPLGDPLATGGTGYELGPNTLKVNTILEDRHGTFWIGTYGSGLFRLSKDGSIRRFTVADGFGDNKITDLLEGHDGRLWISMRSDEKGGVCLLDAEASDEPVKKCYTTKNGLSSNWVRDMYETSDGQLWLATVPGLCRWQAEGDGPVCKTYTAKNGLCDDAFALAEDKDGNLWAGSDCGAQKLARVGFTTYNEADGLDWAEINSIFENSANELFVSTNRAGRGVSRFDGDKFSLVKPSLPDYVNYFGWGWEQTVWQDSAGAWWVPTGYGLFRSPDYTSLENLAETALSKMDTGAKANEIFRIFEDSRGDIWMLTTGAAHDLLRWERATDTWHDYTAQVGFSGYRFGSAFAEDKHGNIWIGASSEYNDSALIRYRRGEFRVLSQAEGAPSGWIGDLFLDSRGGLWIASTNNGLWRLEEPNGDNFEFVKYTSANGLTNNSIASVTEDAFGRIYIGSWLGIDRLTLATGQIENFTTADGLPDSYVMMSYRDRHDNLWFGTKNGLVRFVPEPERARKPPIVLITGLHVNGISQAISVMGETVIKDIELNSDERQVTIDFLGLGASLGEKMRYEYRLNNSDDWTPALERTLNFANLNSGSYLFEVRSITADRIYSLEPATAAFSIAAPIWQRPWFVALILLLTVSAIYFFYKTRFSRLLEMERMRTRIAADLHDDIGANLTRISLLSEVAKQKSTNGNDSLLGSIASIARESVASMNDIVWAIGPDHDRMLDLTRRMRQHAEEIFAIRDIELDFDAPSDDADLKLSVGLRRDVLLIFKEAVSNAARHSGCSNVQIDFHCENSILNLNIKDNGKGFDSDSESEGQGLRSMARRAKALGGTLAIDSSELRGTEIAFKFPLPRISQF